MLICLASFSGSTSSDQSFLGKGISPPNMSGLCISGACGMWEARSSLATASSGLLQLGGWATIPWHSDLDPFLLCSSGAQSACSLPAAGLSCAASPLGKRGKAEPGDRGNVELSQHVSGRAITAYCRCWSDYLVLSLETLWNSRSWRSCSVITPVQVFDHFKHCIIPVNCLLHLHCMLAG